MPRSESEIQVVIIGDAGQDWPAATLRTFTFTWRTSTRTFDRALEAGGVWVQRPQRKDQDPDRRGGVQVSCWQYLVDRDAGSVNAA